MQYILNGFTVESILGPVSMLIVGVCVTWYGIYKKRKILRLRNSGLEAEGIVFDLTKNNDEESADKWVIRFLTKDNIWITKEPSVYFPHYGKKKGEKVQVFYDPDNPDDFIIHNPITFPVFTIAIVVGFIITAIGLFATYHSLTA